MPTRREVRKPPRPRSNLARGGRPSPVLAALEHLIRQQWRMAVAIVLVGGGGTLGLALAFPGGTVATRLNEWQGEWLGWTAPLLALWLTAIGGTLVWCQLRPDTVVNWYRCASALAASATLVGLAGLATYVRADAAAAAQGDGGGRLGFALASVLADALGPVGTGVLLALLLAVSVLSALRVPPRRVVVVVERGLFALHWAARGLARRLRRPRVPQAVPSAPGLRQRLAERVRRRRAARADAEDAGETLPSPPVKPKAGKAPRRPELAVGPIGETPPRSPWRLPPLSLLELPVSPVLAPVDLRQRARIIEETLASFNIGARVAEINEGPTVTQFGVEPAMGVTVSRITARTNDLALRLGATTLRVEAPVPGKRVVGIEVPNSTSAVVSLREILAAPEFVRQKSRLGLALGRDVAGRAVAGDLARMPHLLIAGATGSGKSVCLNGIIACLLMACTPEELQLVMVDPKMVELAPFEGIPHLRLPVVTEMDKVVGVLKWVIQEMERRYALFVRYGVRNLDSYNRAMSGPTPPTPKEKAGGLAAAVEGPNAGGVPGTGAPAKPLPYLVLVIDELADLMMTAPDDVELSLTRLAQKARATGIHLIVATQRPSVDVVTGLIKANFPTRIAFAVTSQVDSRVILDTAGAEKLLGRGDMLYLPAESSKPMRVQGNYVSDAEIEALVAFWREQGEARYDAAEVAAIEALGSSRDDDGEDVFDRACEVVREHSRVSVSLLQRKLGIGYPRAARLLDALAERGVVESTEDGRSWVATNDEPESVGERV